MTRGYIFLLLTPGARRFVSMTSQVRLGLNKLSRKLSSFPPWGQRWSYETAFTRSVWMPSLTLSHELPSAVYWPESARSGSAFVWPTGEWENHAGRWSLSSTTTNRRIRSQLSLSAAFTTFCFLPGQSGRCRVERHILQYKCRQFNIEICKRLFFIFCIFS